MVHGSPREPIWEYLVSDSVARQNFSFFESKICLIGHSHLPLVFTRDERGLSTAGWFRTNVKLVLTANRMIVNPGSVGQPRDGNPQASYAIYDSSLRNINLYRVPYDIKTTQDRMVERGLPIRLVARLSRGI